MSGGRRRRGQIRGWGAGVAVVETGEGFLFIRHHLLPHSRPKTSFNWFVNPLKTFVFFIWRRYWRILVLLLLLALITVFLLLVFYTMPGQISQVTFRPLHRP